MEYSFSYSEILVAILTLIATGFGFIIKEQRDKIKTINNQLSDKKYKLYHEFYTVFFNFIKYEKGNSKVNARDIPTKLIDTKKDLLIYAPDSIVQKFIEWNRFMNKNKGDIKEAKILLELFILIRKDMGHPETKIDEADILKLIMSTDEEIEEMKAIIGL